jgi:hypothetical protein
MSGRRHFDIASSRGSGSDVLDELIGIPGESAAGETAQGETAGQQAAVPQRHDDPRPAAVRTPSSARPAGRRTGAQSRAVKAVRAPAVTSGSTSAHDAVISSFRSARTDPRSWTALSMRLPAELQQRVTERMVRDREASGLPGLAAAHYINAALASIPDDPKVAVDWATEYMEQLGGRGLEAQGVGTRVHRDTRAAIRHLEGQLRMHRYGLHGYLLAAAVERFMDQLQTEDGNEGRKTNRR